MFKPLKFNDIGLGLRPEFLNKLTQKRYYNHSSAPKFLEIAPENWLYKSTLHLEKLHKLSEHYTLVCHGLMLSIGGQKPIDTTFIKQIKQFMNTFEINLYSDHLSYSDDGSYLYDLLPLPMTMESLTHVSQRILQVQDILGKPIALENVSTYLNPLSEMSELEFIQQILAKTDCHIMLDVNNVYVNYHNHQTNYSPEQFIAGIAGSKITYLHVAGHLNYALKDGSNLLIDTHGETIDQAVWQLLKFTYQTHGLKPTLLERDFNIPSLSNLFKELKMIDEVQQDTHALII